MSDSNHSECHQKVLALMADLGLPSEFFKQRHMRLYPDANKLVLADVGRSGREHYLSPDAALSWQTMKQAAARDRIELVLISAYRGFDRQLAILRAKLDAGETIDTVLQTMAVPGCSEHHSGLAVDIGTPGFAALTEAFSQSCAATWLHTNAAHFQFTLSFPKNNPQGFAWEPWHWCYQPGA